VLYQVQHKMMTQRLEKRALYITKFNLYHPISQSLCHQSKFCLMARPTVPAQYR